MDISRPEGEPAWDRNGASLCGLPPPHARRGGAPAGTPPLQLITEPSVTLPWLVLQRRAGRVHVVLEQMTASPLTTDPGPITLVPSRPSRPP
jgi:hypothetical protein